VCPERVCPVEQAALADEMTRAARPGDDPAAGAPRQEVTQP
jgi:hypothetical protein